MVLVVPPELLLVDAAGRAVRPVIPRDACDKPQAEVLRAYRALRLRTLREVRVSRVRTPASSATGCADQWKDIVAFSQAARPGGPGAVLTRPADRVRVCLYRMPAARGQELAVGSLQTGHLTAGADLDGLLARLDAAPPAPPCDRPHTRFAVLSAGVDDVYVEIDGCQRILAGHPSTFRRGEGTTVALVERLTGG